MATYKFSLVAIKLWGSEEGSFTQNGKVSRVRLITYYFYICGKDCKQIKFLYNLSHSYKNNKDTFINNNTFTIQTVKPILL